MKVFGKPENRWGWVRVIAYSVSAGIVTWTLAAAGLRGIGEVPWMAWSGYRTFSFLDGLELVMILLLVAMTAGWLEEHKLKKETELTHHQEAEQALAERREQAVRRLHEAVQAMLTDVRQDLTQIPAQSRGKIFDLVLAALFELDGKGKGELLRFLYERRLLAGEKPLVGLHDADFRGVILTDANLNGICLDEIDLSNAKISGAHLERGRLSGATLSKALMRQADLREASLNGVNLSNANLDGANLEGADLRGAYLKGVFLRNANLNNCTLDNYPARGSDNRTSDMGVLEQAILIDTILPDGRKVTNENGKRYLRDKEYSMLIDKL